MTARVRSRSQALVRVTLLGLVLAGAWPVRASWAAEPINAASGRAVELLVIGSAEREQWLADSLGPESASGATLALSRADQFEPSDVLGASTKPSLAGDPTLYCWVDLRSATHARIYFSDRAGRRFLLRDVELSGAFDELDREALTQVLTSSWSALFEDEQAGLSREETATLLAQRAGATAMTTTPSTTAPPSASSPTVSAKAPADATASRALFLRIGAFYGLEPFSRQLWLTQGPGLSLALGSQGERRSLALWLGAQSRFPQTERDARIGVRLEGVASRAGLELRWPLDGELAHAQRELGVRAGLGLDFTHLSPQAGSEDASAALTRARWTNELVLTLGVGVSTRLTRNATLGLRLFADLLPRLAVYELRTSTGVDAVVSPWHVRPGIALEVETR